MEKIQQPNSPSSKSNNSNCNTKNNVSPIPTISGGRYCHIVKRPDFDGYGFNLHSEKIKPGQYIGKVDPDSPAEAAGLREGDQIIEVNGVNIGVETHKQVVQRIKAISNEVRLLLIDNTENVADVKSQSINSNKSNNHNNHNKNSTTTQIPNSPTTTTTTSSTVTIVPMIVEATMASGENQKDEVTSISLVSTKTQSTYSNNPTVDVTDFDTSEEILNNGHPVTIANGKSSELSTSKVSSEDAPPTTIITTSSPPPPPPPSEQHMMMMDSSNNKSQNTVTDADVVPSQNKPGLNLNLTAAEMRAKLLAKKKFDPKNDSVDLKKKFDIIQKL
ncbi:Na(+)/H(+) exchange regulatory cofactor NHE-RF1 [Episyrphus balteatus]|uniref:Na(+)/H(+) exchange regulatory cofactor NHE-RF1 n=1 Tax=Episyrphus balteatus TaxID=286459 RepID=UPI00248601DD|nr:Na(+)/H(+) exchange regulatory cofactor NHE-RF1 [Episyrphus balteatus]